MRTNFTNADGLVATVINDIAQSRDGLLWINVQGTLTRFDGRDFGGPDDPWMITALAVASNGDLWLGVRDELKRIPAASLNQLGHWPATSYHFASGRNISLLHFSRDGVLWVGADSGLYRFEAGVFLPVIPEIGIRRIEEASNGHLLVITTNGFVELADSRIVPHPELEAQLGVKAIDIHHVFEDSHGIRWFCTAKGVARQIGESLERLSTYGQQGHGALRAYEDPRGNMWFAKTEGLFRATATGLELVAAGTNVTAIYGDREGDLWVGTNGDGLIRFKDRAVRMFTTADGLPSNTAMTVLATHDGVVWSGFNCGGVSRFDGHTFRIYNEKNGLLNSCVKALAEGPNHDLWIGTYGGGLFRFHDEKFTQYSKAQGLASDTVLAMTTARDGSLWVGTNSGVSRLRNGQIRNYTSVDGLPANKVFKVYEDRTGVIWAATALGVSRLVGDRFVGPPFASTDILQPLREDRSGNLYFSATPLGEIFRMEGKRLVNLIPFVGATNMLETREGDLWFSGWRILRVPPGGLDHLHRQDEPLDLEAFGLADGLASTESGAGHPNSTLTVDGRIWIATFKGLAMLDVARLPRTSDKQAIYMKMVTVDRNQQLPESELVLPAGTHHVELNFDAIEISSPEKIHLQYRLDGTDSEWLDVDPPGHAIYSTLPPGTHAFHVRACNRSGIWDRVGTVYYVTQQPYFYQTRWFLIVTIAFGLLVIAAVYQLRLRQLARNLSARFEERLSERTRIARELHDTLLQSFNGVLLRLQAVSHLLPARAEQAKQRVDSTIEQAANAIAEGRDAVQQLRSGESVATSDLAQAIGTLSKELVGDSTIDLHVKVEGKERNFNPLVRDEVYRIAAEALRNAITHASARRIEVEIRYDDQHLRLRIRDDGKGIDPGVLGRGHAPGHWGLRGMRERAKVLGGNLEVWSEVGSGTEIELTVPAASAYAKSASRWSVLWRGWRN